MVKLLSWLERDLAVMQIPYRVEVLRCRDGVSSSDKCTTDSIKLNEIPSYHMKCTGLAKCLYQLVESRQDMETPPILKEWQDAARNDIFPEVKQAWPV